MCPNELANILYSLDHSQLPSGLVIDKESEVYKMLQEKQELNEPPKQSTSFLVLQEILESEEKGNQVCVCVCGQRRKVIRCVCVSVCVCVVRSCCLRPGLRGSCCRNTGEHSLRGGESSVFGRPAS